MKKLITLIALIICISANSQNKDLTNAFEKNTKERTELFLKFFGGTTYDYSKEIAQLKENDATYLNELTKLKHEIEKYENFQSELTQIKARLALLETGDNSGGEDPIDDTTDPIDDPVIEPIAGIVGYGKNTIGGQGGRIIKVTNLKDSGNGSFREACEATGKRIVRFDGIGGRIDVTGETIKITDPNITILGQTASGGGIMLTRETRDRPTLEIDADQVIIQYIKFRRSTVRRSGANPDNLWVNSGRNIVIDHCSFAWATDGNLDLANYDGQPGRPPKIEIQYVTIQNCIFTNPYGGTNKNHLVSRGATHISWFRNAFLSTATRNPSISTPENEAPTWDCYYEFINNFQYDYSNGVSFSNNDTSTDAGIYYANVINNRAMENTTSSGIVDPNIETYPSSKRRWLRAKTSGNGMKIYVEGNITPYRPNESYDEWQIGQNGGGEADRNTLVPENLRSYTIIDTPIIKDGVSLLDSNDIWEAIRLTVGASLPQRDSEDARAVNDVDTGQSTENKTQNSFPQQ